MRPNDDMTPAEAQELRRWAKVAFRPTRLQNLAAARAQLAAEEELEHQTAAGHKRRRPKLELVRAEEPDTLPDYGDTLAGASAPTVSPFRLTPQDVAVGAVLLGAGYLIGRWWRHRHDAAKRAAAKTVVHGLPDWVAS